MSVDHYAGAARRWAEGATLVYRPIARELLATSPHSFAGRSVLDAGAGTGVASAPLVELGAKPIAVDRSLDMLAWRAGERPPAVAADINRLPFRPGAFDDLVCAFVLNHVTNPQAAISEAARTVRGGGAMLACVYANASRSEVRNALDEAAMAAGWQVPQWYLRLKQIAAPLLGTAADMARVATAAGLVDVSVDERPVDVGVTQPEQLVDYRLGQAQFSTWLRGLDPERTAEIRDRLVAAIRPKMTPYHPIVVFLAATVR